MKVDEGKAYGSERMEEAMAAQSTVTKERPRGRCKARIPTGSYNCQKLTFKDGGCESASGLSSPITGPILASPTSS